MPILDRLNELDGRIPWSCAAVIGFLSSLSEYRERPKLRQFAQLSLVVSIGVLVLALTFATIYGYQGISTVSATRTSVR